jgi:ACR3 family arsenite efflux pump ArsB
MKENKLKPLRGMLVLFVLLTAIFLVFKDRFIQKGFNTDLLIGGNLLLMIASLVSYVLLYRGMQSANPNSFVRAMYLSFILKFFIIALAAFIYIMVVKKEVNKPSLVACAALYIVYTFLEVSVLTKLLKQKKNA